MANGPALKKEKDKPKKERVIPMRKLINKLDCVFSEHIRKRDKGKCFTCGVVKPWKQMQCGHYEDRRHLAIRWDERNCNCQCVACNVFLHGNRPVYAVRLREKYDKGILERLRNLTKIETHLKAEEMKEWIEYYKKENLN